MDASQIPLESVSSSNVLAMGYDEETQTCVVEFKRGGKYKIHPMTEYEYLDLREADSIGRHYNTEVKNNSKYDITKL